MLGISRILKQNYLAKTVAILLMFSFIAFQVSWAKPNTSLLEHFLAGQSVFQQKMITPDMRGTQEAMRIEAKPFTFDKLQEMYKSQTQVIVAA